MTKSRTVSENSCQTGCKALNVANASMNVHATYSKDAAIAAFEGEPQLLCDGQFALLSTAVLAFLTMGKPTDGS